MKIYIVRIKTLCAFTKLDRCASLSSGNLDETANLSSRLNQTNTFPTTVCFMFLVYDSFFNFFRRTWVIFGATGTHDLDFWWCLPWVSKGEWILIACFIACVQWISQIHLWCDICWPLDGHHCSEIFFDPHPFPSFNVTPT